MPALRLLAFAALEHIAKNYKSNQHLVINVSGRGDKDIIPLLLWMEYLD